MDITRMIHDAENSLRDFIDTVMTKHHGSDWYTELPAVAPLAAIWKKNRLPDEMEHNSIKGREKLIQYATLVEIRLLIHAHWENELQEVFEDQAILDVYLKILDDYRNPDSRRRELFVHQKHLLLGISGDIRNRITTWRSKSEAGGIYSRIETVRDNLGNNWTPGQSRKIKTNNAINVGDVLEFIITASDPEDAELRYRCHHTRWQTNNVVLVPVERSMIEQQSVFHLMVKSSRKHHAYPMGMDDRVSFSYEVLPG